MPSIKKRIPIYLTDEQYLILEHLLKISEEQSMASLIRRLLGEYATQNNFDWQDNNQWGGERILYKGENSGE
ncbi:MAG: hypothetical protein SH821_05895 [Phototrophicales bacterium]|mgnify:CR=1 FL=1|nr:hypothetical protein [Phototrophicales bacterium]